MNPVHEISILLQYKQMFLQTLYDNRNLVTDQVTGDENTLYYILQSTPCLSQQPHQIKNKSIHHTQQSTRF
jgi:hypothetical protein